MFLLAVGEKKLGSGSIIGKERFELSDLPAPTRLRPLPPSRILFDLKTTYLDPSASNHQAVLRGFVAEVAETLGVEDGNNRYEAVITGPAEKTRKGTTWCVTLKSSLLPNGANVS